MTKVSGFKDANGREVFEGDEVEYRIGARRGIMYFCGRDGVALVQFFDTNKTEDVNWIHLCGVPDEYKTSRRDRRKARFTYVQKQKEARNKAGTN